MSANILGLSKVFLYCELNSFIYSSVHYIVTPTHTFISGGIICDMLDVKVFLVLLSFGFIRIWDFISIFYLIVRDYTYQCGNPGSKSRGSEFYISELLCFNSKAEIWICFDISKCFLQRTCIFWFTYFEFMKFAWNFNNGERWS